MFVYCGQLFRNRACVYIYIYMCIYIYIAVSFGFAGGGNSFAIGTRYGLDVPGIESQRRARFSAPVQTGPGAQPASYTSGTGSAGGKAAGAWR